MSIISMLIISMMTGVGIGYAYEHAQVKLCEAAIESANLKTAHALTEKEAEVEKLTANQTITNISLEAEHAKNIELISNNGANLDDARRMWVSNQPRCSRTLPKTHHPSVNKNDDGRYMDAEQLSRGVEALIQRADTESANHHAVMQFLNNIPTELKE